LFQTKLTCSVWGGAPVGSGGEAPPGGVWGRSPQKPTKIVKMHK